MRFAGGEIASATVTGAPATFEQKRENEQPEGRANRIDYDLKRGTVRVGRRCLAVGRRYRDHRRDAHLQHGEPALVISDEPVVITIQPRGARDGAEKPKPQP